MVQYARAIKRPFQDTTTLIIGIILGLIPIVSNLTVPGFGLRCAKASLKGDGKLPKWEDWGDIIVKSIAVLVISIVYLIPAALVVLWGVGSAILTLATNPAAFITAFAGAGAAMVLAAILFILAFLFSPLGAVHYLKSGSFLKAFALGEIARKVFTGAYIVAWLFSVVYFVILLVVFAVLSVVPVVGALIGAGIFNFLGSVTSMTVYAEAYKEAK